MGSKERKAVDAFGIECVRAVSLHLVIVSWLAFLFCLNDNSYVFLKPTGNLLFLLCTPMLHFVLAKAALSGMP